jgi:hypothetical protein
MDSVAADRSALALSLTLPLSDSRGFCGRICSGRTVAVATRSRRADSVAATHRFELCCSFHWRCCYDRQRGHFFVPAAIATFALAVAIAVAEASSIASLGCSLAAVGHNRHRRFLADNRTTARTGACECLGA